MFRFDMEETNSSRQAQVVYWFVKLSSGLVALLYADVDAGLWVAMRFRSRREEEQQDIGKKDDREDGRSEG